MRRGVGWGWRGQGGWGGCLQQQGQPQGQQGERANQGEIRVGVGAIYKQHGGSKRIKMMGDLKILDIKNNRVPVHERMF